MSSPHIVSFLCTSANTSHREVVVQIAHAMVAGINAPSRKRVSDISPWSCCNVHGTPKPAVFSCVIHGMTYYATHLLGGLEFHHTQARATQLTADSSTRAGEAEVNRIRQEHEAQQASNGTRVRGKGDLPESNDSHIGRFLVLSIHDTLVTVHDATLRRSRFFHLQRHRLPTHARRGNSLFQSITIVRGHLMQPLIGSYHSVCEPHPDPNRPHATMPENYENIFTNPSAEDSRGHSGEQAEGSTEGARG